MSESNSTPKSCGACKFYEYLDSTCRIRSAVAQFPARSPSEYCHEFVVAKKAAESSKKKAVKSAAALAIDKDPAWQVFVAKLKADSKAKRRSSEKLFRRVAETYSLETLTDFEKVTAAQLLTVPGVGKQWAYNLSEILAEFSIFNTTVLSRTGEQI